MKEQASDWLDEMADGALTWVVNRALDKIPLVRALRALDEGHESPEWPHGEPGTADRHDATDFPQVPDVLYLEAPRLGGGLSQGFARRGSVVSFGTLLQFGHANILVIQDSYRPQNEYKRVIAVPFLITSGKVMVCGPEEANDPSKRIDIPPGNYRVVAAQRVTGDENDEQSFDLSFESVLMPLTQSTILIADDALNPPTPLLETVGISGED